MIGENVDAESAVEGWARSGSFVDVILLRMTDNTRKGLEAKIIAENVKILSANRSTEPIGGSTTAPRAPTTVTILATQEDALTIKTAASIGKLTFALRGRDDQSPTLVTTMNQQRLLGQSRDVSNQVSSLKGFAKAPDGRVFVLGGDAKWIRSKKIPATFDRAKGKKSAKDNEQAKAKQSSGKQKASAETKNNQHKG